MIVTLLITIVVEGLVVLGYCHWRKRSLRPILFTSIWGNLLTQSLLWIALNLFFKYYLIVLFTAEILIWLIESALLSFIPANRLQLKESMLLSLSMNLVSFILGWFLPV